MHAMKFCGTFYYKHAGGDEKLGINSFIGYYLNILLYVASQLM